MMTSIRLWAACALALVVLATAFVPTANAQAAEGCVLDGDFVETVASQRECNALVAFHDKTNGVVWGPSQGWDFDVDPCTWWGVGCNAVGVTRLQMTDFTSIEGRIPVQLGNLEHLEVLQLQENQLRGPIPAQLGRLSNLRVLQLNENNLVGPLPAELSDLASIETMWLYRNKIDGAIPPELGSLAAVRDLRLHFNQLEGEIPGELANLDTLRTLTLSGNRLSGTIPAEFGDFERLDALTVDRNELSGDLTASIGPLIDQLRILDLNRRGPEGNDCFTASGPVAEWLDENANDSYGIYWGLCSMNRPETTLDVPARGEAIDDSPVTIAGTASIGTTGADGIAVVEVAILDRATGLWWSPWFGWVTRREEILVTPDDPSAPSTTWSYAWDAAAAAGSGNYFVAAAAETNRAGEIDLSVAKGRFTTA